MVGKITRIEMHSVPKHANETKLLLIVTRKLSTSALDEG